MAKNKIQQKRKTQNKLIIITSKKLVLLNRNVLALDLSELGRAKKLYKVQVGFRLIAEIKIKQMMDANIIRPSNSPYSLPFLLTWKPNGVVGSWINFFCVDSCWWLYYLAIYFRFFASSCILGDSFYYILVIGLRFSGFSREVYPFYRKLGFLGIFYVFTNNLSISSYRAAGVSSLGGVMRHPSS